MIAVLPGQAEFLGSIYAFGAMLSFSMAHLAVIRLRVTQPEHRRPLLSPGALRVRGHVLPPFAVIGLAGTGLSFVTVSALDPVVAVAGFSWLALGVTVFVLYRRHYGLDLTTTVKVAIRARHGPRGRVRLRLVHMPLDEGYNGQDPRLRAARCTVVDHGGFGIRELISPENPNVAQTPEPIVG